MPVLAPLSCAELPELRRFLDDTVGGTVDVWRAHGDLAVFSNGRQQTIFVSGPAHNRTVFGRTDVLLAVSGLPGPRNSAQRAFSRGIFGLSGPDHLAARRLLLPSFKKPALDGYHDRLTGCVREVIRDWRAGQTRDLYREMKAISLAITDRLLFGLDDPELAGRVDDEFVTWLDLNHRASFASTLLGTDGSAYAPLLESAERLGEMLRAMIAARRKLPLTGDDLLAPVLAAQAAGELTETDVLGLVHSLFNAAHHTTTASLSWALFLIAQHPEVNAALLDELSGGDASGRFDRFPLLDRVIKESVRVLPPVVYVSRMCAAPVRFGEVEMPVRSLVVCGLYTTMHEPATFPRPDAFDPSRWTSHAACPHANVAFGAGARMCLGAPLATHLMQIALGLIVPRFRLTVVPGARIDRHATLTLRPAQGIPVLIRDQDRNFSTSPVSGTIHEMVELPVTTTGTVAA
jgi:cytochrome P450